MALEYVPRDAQTPGAAGRHTSIPWSRSYDLYVIRIVGPRSGCLKRLDIADIEIIFVDERDEMINPLGIKGVGENRRGRYRLSDSQRNLSRHRGPHSRPAYCVGQAISSCSAATLLMRNAMHVIYRAMAARARATNAGDVR